MPKYSTATLVLSTCMIVGKVGSTKVKPGTLQALCIGGEGECDPVGFRRLALGCSLTCIS
jgi:hypothetical protein